MTKRKKPKFMPKTRDDLILATLTKDGELTEGDVGDLAGLAAWLDHVNHDGSTAEGVGRDLARLAAEGRIALEGGRFRLLRPLF
jgi:hypothetical protein